jgi:uncharacterized membrane protein YoaK (UPF0700 family)
VVQGMTRTGMEFAATLLLAATGGYGDAASLLLVHCFTGHVTGNLVLAVVGATSGTNHAWEPALAVCCFLASTALAQRLRNPHNPADLGVRFVLILEIVLLCLGPWLFALHPAYLIAALCCGLGLQNGTLSQVNGVALHTTFLSGTLTHLINPQATPRERRLLPLVGLGFVIGAVCGGLLVTHAGPKGLWGMPLLLLAVLGLWFLMPRACCQKPQPAGPETAESKVQPSSGQALPQ